MWETLLPLVLIFGIFYFILIRPQQRKMKKHQNMLNNLSKGDTVVTEGGIHGTVIGLKENSNGKTGIVSFHRHR